MRNSPKIKFIKQKNKKSGCGPACVAMVADVTYEKAVVAIFGEFRKRKLYTTYDNLRHGLKTLGVPYCKTVQRHRSWGGITGLSIVKCDVKKNKSWHWVVYDGRTQRLFDPLEDRQLAPKANRKISSHLPVRQRAIRNMRAARHKKISERA